MSDLGSQLIRRQQEEADDVLAAVDYLKTVKRVDASRLGIHGYSFGGIVTMFAIARSDTFRAAVDQAGGALTWPRSAALRAALITAAKETKTPVMLMVAKNDRTTESITTLAGVLKRRNAVHESIVYPDFTPASIPAGVAPGHLIFGAGGVELWKKDVIAFFDKYLKPGAAI